MHRVTRPSSARRPERGFSFIELLIVMGIIGVLVAGALIVLALWQGEQKPLFETRNTLTKLKLHIEDWENRYELYPPAEMPEVARVNAINVGNESVNQALLRPGSPIEPQWSKSEIGNQDGDALPRPVNRRGTTALTETLDGYGNPFVYLHASDYARHADAGVKYTSRDANGERIEVSPRPHRHDDGSFVNPNGFQLFSMGPDGIPNTEDDITIWN